MALADKYREFIEATKQLEPHARHGLLMATMRSLLQTTALCLFDVVYDHCKDDEAHYTLQNSASLLTQQHPPWLTKDAEPISEIRKLIGHVRSNDRQGEPALCPNLDNKLLKKCDDWVQHRNEVAHGVPNATVVNSGLEWLPELCVSLLDAVSEVLPERVGTKGITKSGRNILSLPPEASATPVVFRRVVLSPKGSSIHFLRLITNGEPRGIETLRDDSPIVRLGNPGGVFRPVKRRGSQDEILVRIPERSVFVGQEKALDDMLQWWDDPGGAVLVVHSPIGGIGKTALVVEFIYKWLLDGWGKYSPRLICFGSAKRTRFAAGQLGDVKNDVDGVQDFVDLLCRCPMENGMPMGKSNDRWMDLRFHFERNGISPRDVLVVIDNAELIDVGEESAFAKKVSHVARRVGFRVILTSRRDEHDVAGFKLRVGNLSMVEAIDLARKRAEISRVQSILSARAALQDALNPLEGIPVLIVSLVDYVAQQGGGLEAAAKEVGKKGEMALADFWYEPAWKNMREVDQNILISVWKLGACSQSELETICAGMGGAFASLETRGFGEARFLETYALNGPGDYTLPHHARVFVAEMAKGISGRRSEKIDEVVAAVRDGGGGVSSLNMFHRAVDAWKNRKEFGEARVAFESLLKMNFSREQVLLSFAEFCAEIGGYEAKKLLGGDYGRELKGTRAGLHLLLKVASARRVAEGREFEDLVDKAKMAQLEDGWIELSRANFFLHKLGDVHVDFRVPDFKRIDETEEDFESRREMVKERLLDEFEEYRSGAERAISKLEQCSQATPTHLVHESHLTQWRDEADRLRRWLDGMMNLVLPPRFTVVRSGPVSRPVFV